METPNDIRVNSWAELNEVVFKDSWQESIRRFRSPYVFRGLSSTSHDLKTSLMRLGGRYVRLEAPLLRNFRKYAHSTADPGDSIWHWLALAQHHGLPTRLLDWTFSPFVALHFATQDIDAFEIEAAIWCVNLWKVRDAMPPQLQAILHDEYAAIFHPDILDRSFTDLKAFDALADDPFVIFFEPPSLDERIVNQAGMFSMMSSPSAALDEWLFAHPETYRRIIIPAAMKWEVRDKLDQMNINERILFPGLDGLSAWLKRNYSPNNLPDTKD